VRPLKTTTIKQQTKEEAIIPARRPVGGDVGCPIASDLKEATALLRTWSILKSRRETDPKIAAPVAEKTDLMMHRATTR
jgi:hypothetical protein